MIGLAAKCVKGCPLFRHVVVVPSDLHQQADNHKFSPGMRLLTE
jgi:hypothetical protein